MPCSAATGWFLGKVFAGPEKISKKVRRAAVQRARQDAARALPSLRVRACLLATGLPHGVQEAQAVPRANFVVQYRRAETGSPLYTTRAPAGAPLTVAAGLFPSMCLCLWAASVVSASPPRHEAGAPRACLHALGMLAGAHSIRNVGLRRYKVRTSTIHTIHTIQYMQYLSPKRHKPRAVQTVSMPYQEWRRCTGW